MALQFGRGLGQPDEVDPDLLAGIRSELADADEVAAEIENAGGVIPSATLEAWYLEGADPIDELAAAGFHGREASSVLRESLEAQRRRAEHFKLWLMIVSALLGVSVAGLIYLVSRSKK